MAKGKMSAADRDYLKVQGAELYCKGFSQKNIAKLLSVTEKTIGRWSKEDDWEGQAKLNNIRPSEIRRMILQYVQDLKDGNTPQYKADDLSKIAAAFDRLNDKRKKAVYTMESFDNFSSFVLEKAGSATGEKREALLAMLKNVRIYFNFYVTTLLRSDD